MIVSTVFDRKTLKEITTRVIDDNPDGPDLVQAFVEFVYPAAVEAGVFKKKGAGDGWGSRLPRGKGCGVSD